MDSDLTTSTITPTGAPESNGDGTQMIPPPTPPPAPTSKEECKSYQVQTDCYVYRVIVWTLAAVVAITLLGSLSVTVISARPIPEMFVAFGSGALGALAGLLAPPPNRQGGN
jgi:hypothetical protein